MASFDSNWVVVTALFDHYKNLQILNNVTLASQKLHKVIQYTVLKKFKKNVLFLGSATGNYLVYLPMFRLFKSRFPTMATSDTQVCIDGFPRSGNTYFVSAFQSWNQGLTISHHTHLAGSIKYALKRDTPTAVLIRKPEDVLASVLVWDGLLSTSVALLSYIHFYRTLWKYREKFIVLTFDDVTQAPDICVQRINHRFDRQFNNDVFSLNVDGDIRARLKRADLYHHRKGVNSSLPNSDKTQLKRQYSGRVQNNCLYPYAKSVFLKYSELPG